jgi:hypothetical protein
VVSARRDRALIEQLVALVARCAVVSNGVCKRREHLLSEG